jgi:hypothetical protein
VQLIFKQPNEPLRQLLPIGYCLPPRVEAVKDFLALSWHEAEKQELLSGISLIRVRPTTRRAAVTVVFLHLTVVPADIGPHVGEPRQALLKTIDG